MNNFESVKESGKEVIGTIPSHWEVVRIKYLTKVRKEISINGKEELLSVSESKGIVKRRELTNNDENLTRSENLSGYRIVKKGDLVNNIMLVWKRGLGVSQFNGIVSPAYSVFSFNKNCFPKYFNYLFRTDQYITEFTRFSTGIIKSRLRLYDDSFGNIFSHLPTLKEQQLISKYLDERTQKIDLLIEKIEKKIELLKEQKTVLINHYVTKGLDPNMEMKDSGVEWIGEIPKSWEFKKLKYFSEIIYGISPSEKTYNDEGIGTLLINGPVEYSKKDFGLTRSLKWTTEPTKIVQKGSLLFCLRGSTTGRMNITHDEVSIGRGVCAIKSKFDQDFLVFAMMMVRIYIQDQISGSTFPSVTKDDVDNFIIPLPDHEEQKKISSQLKSKIKFFEQYIELNNNKIKLLKEYKESLISSVVTGKIRISEDTI